MQRKLYLQHITQKLKLRSYAKKIYFYYNNLDFTDKIIWLMN